MSEVRLIDANVLKENTLKKRGLPWESMQHVFCITGEELDNAPTVEPQPFVNITFNEEKMKEFVAQAKAEILAEYKIERPQGEWISHADSWKKTCSNCGFNWKHVDEFDFCPNCGADMRKGEC